jgi:hypothetical protein
MSNFRDVIQALLPDGVIWNPVEGGFFDKLLKGIGDNTKSVYENLKQLAFVRDPSNTPILIDLEKEYGIVTDLRLTEEERRTALAAVKYAKPGTGSRTDLETILRDAGLDVYVWRNDPPVDPDIFITSGFQMVAGGDLAFAGDPEAYAGFTGAELLVNGPSYTATVLYDMEANGASSFAGEPNAVAGFFAEVQKDFIEYGVPASPERWPYIFFVGGDRFGWIQLKDWNMEKEGNTDWIPSPGTTAFKDDSVSESGVRSLRVVANNQDVDEQLILPSNPDPSLRKSYGMREVVGGFMNDDAWLNFVQDGDMERTGFTNWTAGGSATLSKQTGTPYSGKQVLRVTNAGFARQIILTIGKKYQIIGVARSADGVGVPSITISGTPPFPQWQGTNSTNWQSFDFVITALNTGILLYNSAAASSSEFDHIIAIELSDIVDEDMEAVGVGSWLVGNSATLTKNTEFPRSGLQALRVAYNGVNDPYAYQDVYNTHGGANDYAYKVTGWARSVDGAEKPIVKVQTSTAWEGTKSTNWQRFEFTRLAIGTELRFYAENQGIVEFDDIEISPILGAVGVVTGTSFVETELGPARDFNGSSDYITGGAHVGVLGFDLDDRFTLSSWVKVQPTTAQAQSIISRNDGGANRQWDFILSITGEMVFEDSAAVNFFSGQTVNDGDFHLVSVVIDGANSQFYYDGAAVGSTFNPTITSKAVATLFGAYNSGAGRFFKGIMVSPQIYSEPKDAAWMLAQYNAGVAAQLQGAYVEQLIDSDDMELPVDGFAWSDNIDGTPCVAILDPSDGLWKLVWIGSSITALKQTISAVAPNGIDGIRLYNKFTENGYVNFDDISIIDPVIEKAQVPIELKDTLRNLVLKYKPLHSWAGLIVEYI